MVEQSAVNRLVAGSSPAVGAILKGASFEVPFFYLVHRQSMGQRVKIKGSGVHRQSMGQRVKIKKNIIIKTPK